MTPEDRLKKLRLRGMGYPVRIWTLGGRYSFFLYGCTYFWYGSLAGAVERAIGLVEDHNKPITQ